MGYFITTFPRAFAILKTSESTEVHRVMSDVRASQRDSYGRGRTYKPVPFCLRQSSGDSPQRLVFWSTRLGWFWTVSLPPTSKAPTLLRNCKVMMATTTGTSTSAEVMAATTATTAYNSR